MIQFDFAENCCGCRACENICPANAIHMTEDNSGFLYPSIDSNQCLKCGLCDIVCPYLNAEKNRINKGIPVAWLYASEHDEIKLRSASGGAFYELAHRAIKEGYNIVGCAWNSELNAEHIVINAENELKRLQGSKYVQSDVKNCYAELKEMLLNGKKVLFSGTPCQVEAAHNMAMILESGKCREQLLTVAVICHGVATPKAWNSYKTYLQKTHGSRLVNVNFRNKEKEGYKKSYCKYDFENSDVIYLPTFLPSSKYMEATLVYNLAMRKSCSQCSSKGISTACDIVLGDWYEEHTGKGVLGTSCLVAFTERGKSVVLDYLDNLREISYEEIVEKNGFIENSVTLGINRDEFLSNLDDIDMWDDVERLYPKKYIIKRFLIRVGLYDVIKKFI